MIAPAAATWGNAAVVARGALQWVAVQANCGLRYTHQLLDISSSLKNVRLEPRQLGYALDGAMQRRQTHSRGGVYDGTDTLMLEW
jgi:hypothetical protein